MNKPLKIIFSILGGIETAFSVGIPIMVAILWVKYNPLIDWSSNIFIVAGICASLFRGIKIGFLKNS